MSHTILIVDDEERMRKLIGAYLNKEGYDILEAENGLQALNVFKNNKVHLLILDVMMPMMDGWTVCTEIRKISSVPIIMLTAKGEDDDKILAYELGSDQFVTKPFNIRLLLAKVRSLVSRFYSTELQIKKELNFDGLVIDVLSHKVSLEGSEITLTPKEYDLLLYFSSNHGIVLSREKILDTIWGMDFYGDLRTVDTYIKRVREKLGTKGYLLSTVRGAGYRFEVKDEN
jgi:DNA-binding response OmpR family regulator